MGASGAYGGSSGRAWGRAREHADDFAANPTDENAQALLKDIAEALDWDGDEGTPPAIGTLTPVVARLRSAAGGGANGGRGGSTGTGGPGGGGGAGGGSGGSRRSRAQAATVGGAVAAAGLALRSRDEATLGRFGLTLAELDGLDAHEQARRILDAVAGSVGAIQEDELQHASAVAILALLDQEAMPEDGVREFVADYVFEISITEVGDELRDGTRDGYTTVEQEDRLRDLIVTSVNQLELPDYLDAENIQHVIYKALDDARTYLRAGK